MVIPTKQQDKATMLRVFKEILCLEDDSNLHKACDHERFKDLYDLLALPMAELADISHGSAKINNHDQGDILALQHLYLDRAYTLDPIARDWSNLSKEEFEIYRTSPGLQAIFPPEPEPAPIIVPAVINPSQHVSILRHVLEIVMDDDPGSLLALAIDQHGCQTIQDVMALTPWEIESLELEDGSTLPRDRRIYLEAFQAFVLSLYPNPDSIVTEEWLSLTSEEFYGFMMSAEWMLFRQQSPRPVPPRDDTINGEQYKNWGATEVIESFDVEEFQAAMVHASETIGCSEEEEESEDTTTDDNNSMKILNDAIMFFEFFWLEDDFQLHSLDEPNVPNEEFEFVPLSNDKPSLTTNEAHEPSPTTNEAHEPHYARASMEDDVHVEYPDRTKFVSSMTQEQYQELKLYKDNERYADY